MAEPDFLLCDRCEEKLPRECRLSVKGGKELDAAGDVDLTCITVDLCHQCLVEFVRRLSVGDIGGPYALADAMKRHLEY